MDSSCYYPLSAATSIIAGAHPGCTIVPSANEIIVFAERAATVEEATVTVFKQQTAYKALYLTIDDVPHVRVSTDFSQLKATIA